MIPRVVPVLLAAAAFVAAGSPVPVADAAVFAIDISPLPGVALNLGSTTYPGDDAQGLNPLNEVSLGNAGTATGTGGETGLGITFDDVTRNLTLNFAYGAAFGFSNLGSNWNGGVHIHGPAVVGANAAVIVNLASLHTASGTRAGSVSGVVNLSIAQAQDLFDNELYINIHSTDNPNGEIRGQLIVVPEPSSALLAAAAAATALLFSRRR